MSTSGRFPWPTRRHFLLQVLAAAGCGSSGAGTTGETGESSDSSSGGETPTTGEPTSGETGTSTGGPALSGDPFTLGVASGDPLPDSVILWTRLALDPTVAGGGMPDEVVSVIWEVSIDEAFAELAAAGEADADPTFAHSLHIDVQGLAPDTWYAYRFKVGEWTSPTGRTRTLPAADSSPERLRFATASCQSWVAGHYNAYTHLVEEDLDLLFFLGDYIYENGATGPIRSHVNPEPTTLDEYRVRHALYKSDERLQAAHAKLPWAVIWDDHEVENDYAGDFSQDDAPQAEWLARRAAAYQAYYEHMPLRLPPPEGPDYKIYRSLRWGDLADFWLLDTRQYRDNQLCGDDPGAGCDGWDSYEGTFLGDEQEQWLKDGMSASAATWKLIAQQVVFATLSFGGSLVNFDQWDGYPVARQRILDFINDEAIANVVVLSGDIHLGGLIDLAAIADQDDSPTIAAEIVTTSISSSGDIPEDTVEVLLAQVPRVKYFNTHARGYVVHDIQREAYAVRCFVVDTVLEPTSAGHVEAEFFIDAGTPGFRQ